MAVSLSVYPFHFLLPITFFKKIYIYLFIYLAALGLHCCTGVFSLVVASGGYSSLRWEGFSLRWLLL